MTKAVRFGKEIVYAFISTEGGKIRMRVSADECDRLDLFVGNQVRLSIDGGEVLAGLVVDVTREPPFVWVAMEIATPGRGI